jgi:predicted nucleic acid-binding protein
LSQRNAKARTPGRCSQRSLQKQTEIGISVAHGAVRADTPERKAKRRQFIQELQTALPIYLVTATLAVRAGEIDGENQARGVRLPLSDLLIGVTAVGLSYSVATANVRHFQMIPGLTVVQF